MPRSMVKYQFIVDEQERSATMRRRKASIFKMMSELKTLCDVDTCLVMYEKDGAQPHVWPSAIEAYHVLKRFQESNLMGMKAIQDHNMFLEKHIAKMEKQLEKEREKNLKHLMVKCLFDESALSEIKNNKEDLEGLCASIENEQRALSVLFKEACEKAKKKLVQESLF